MNVLLQEPVVQHQVQVLPGTRAHANPDTTATIVKRYALILIQFNFAEKNNDSWLVLHDQDVYIVHLVLYIVKYLYCFMRHIYSHRRLSMLAMDNRAGIMLHARLIKHREDSGAYTSYSMYSMSVYTLIF